MPAWQLAQLDIAKMRGPLDSPAMADFVANLDRINATAESADGFIWRDVDALKEFVYRSAHAPIMRRRREWFDGMSEAYMVLWWVPAGHRPTEAEAIARLERLRKSGSGADAFIFREPFPMPASAPLR